MNRPSRGARTSAATTRYVGCFCLPIRMRRSLTATVHSLRVQRDSTTLEAAVRPVMLDCDAGSVQAGPGARVQARQRERLLGDGGTGALRRDASPALALAAL